MSAQQCDISIAEGKFWVDAYLGEVVGQQKWSETYVSGNAHSVGSTTHENLEFWIREKDGTEKHFRLNNTGLGVRPGQKVWIAACGDEKTGKGKYLFTGNLTTNSVHDLESFEWWKSACPQPKSSKRFKILLIVLYLIFLMSMSTSTYTAKDDFAVFFFSL